MPVFLTIIILGVIEGITEFLPISSTGHLMVAERLLDFRDTEDLFTVVIQIGAILAVVWFYRLDLWQKTIGVFRRQSAALHFWKVLIIATIPAGLIGLAIEQQLDKLSSPAVIAAALIIGGIILWLVEQRTPKVYRLEAQTIDFDGITPQRALLIGLGQSVALIPGVSRSGATIVSGLLSGLNRPTATAFSFYLSIPILVLASGLKIVKHGSEIAGLPGGYPGLLIGLAASFVTALLAVSWLLHYITRHDFKPFAYYRVVIGVIILGLVAAHQL